MKISKSLLAGVAVTGAASFAVGVTGIASAATPTTGMLDTSNVKQTTTVDASLATQLGLGLGGTSLLQGDKTDVGLVGAAKVNGGVKATNSTTTKDGTTSSTSVGANANAGAAAQASASDDKANVGAGLTGGANVDATNTTSTGTGNTGSGLTSGLLNGGLLDGSLLSL